MYIVNCNNINNMTVKEMKSRLLEAGVSKKKLRSMKKAEVLEWFAVLSVFVNRKVDEAILNSKGA
jgi:hypothetical protein